MKRIVILFLLFICGFLPTGSCITRSFMAHPQGSGMGGATVALEGMWAGFSNPAGLGFSSTPSMGFGFQQTLTIKETGEGFGVINIPSSLGNWGAVANFQGMEDYQELFLGLSFSRRVGKKWWAGLQFDYLRIHFPEEKGQGLITFTAGVLLEVLPRCFLGAFVFNPQGSSYHFLYYDEEIPRVMGAGLQVGAGKDLRFMGDWHKVYSQKGSIHLGCEWRIHPRLGIRFGGQSNPEQLTVGAVFSFGKFHAETGFRRISSFGNITTGAFGWQPKYKR